MIELLTKTFKTRIYIGIKFCEVEYKQKFEEKNE